VRIHEKRTLTPALPDQPGDVANHVQREVLAEPAGRGVADLVDAVVLVLGLGDSSGKRALSPVLQTWRNLNSGCLQIVLLRICLSLRDRLFNSCCFFWRKSRIWPNCLNYDQR
jgi:hypothetical protein